MTRSSVRRHAARPLLLAACAATLAGCRTAGPASANAAPAPITVGGRTPAELARADSGRPPFTAADVRFMSGMIGHHGQAVLMAAWAPTHGASPSLRILAERIAVSQRDEIAFMQRWLRERRQPVPDGDASHALMADMDHSHDMPLMPGMLTPPQLAQLDSARGPQFDRLFLTFMIQHHQGALGMVEQLFGSAGAGQDDAVFKFASDVSADQTTEIDAMRRLLAAMPATRSTP